jgi:RNA polymerase sigma-70 factor (ECF subfamily)
VPPARPLLAQRTEGWDPETVEWVRSLSQDGAAHAAAVRRLHEMLLRVARAELHRRSAGTGIAGAELDDLAHQAAADAQMSIIAKLDRFRGESRFSSWAYRFVIFEVSKQLGRHFWRRDGRLALSDEDWSRLPDRFGLDPANHAEWADLIRALRRAVDERLTAHQRRLFVAIVLNGVPLDTMVLELDSNRNAIYKALFDARRKLRAALVEAGHLEPAGEALA